MNKSNGRYKMDALKIYHVKKNTGELYKVEIKNKSQCLRLSRILYDNECLEVLKIDTMSSHNIKQFEAIADNFKNKG
ncbi:MAG: hypothetical protein U9Q66_00475 [Patescibacteria group bacterium]|nr:hypothetical protein [Patescibacteria group bacterium]